MTPINSRKVPARFPAKFPCQNSKRKVTGELLQKRIKKDGSGSVRLRFSGTERFDRFRVLKNSVPRIPLWKGAPLCLFAALSGESTVPVSVSEKRF